MHLIKDNKINRFQVLLNLYVAVNGYYDIVKNLKMIAEHQAITGNDFKSAFKYLAEEELIELREGDGEYFASLSHKGLKAVEEVFLDPNKETYYFPSYREMKE